MAEKIEILPVSLLQENPSLVRELKRLARTLGIEFGWHYLLDLTWILAQLGVVRGRRIVDAGAGVGIMQWRLADHGAIVVSVDRENRAFLPLHFRSRYQVRGLRPGDLASPGATLQRQLAQASRYDRKVSILLRELKRMVLLKRFSGQVTLYNQNLMNLPGIASESQDAVVAVSALEHNPPADLGTVVAELLRILKPGGLLLVTLCAARDLNWFHEPSQGWCYTEAFLRGAFDLALDVPSNYSCYDELFAALKDCAELRDNLARFYASSGDNGMPWGIWDPQYQPVGVCKVKPGS